MLLRENLFKNVNNSSVTSECIYYIGDTWGNTKLVLCYDTNTKKIYSSADEWLHLIQIYYTTVPGHPYYTNLVNNYNHVINISNVNTTFAKDKIIPFITSFSKGTVHGYSGLFYIIKNTHSDNKTMDGVVNKSVLLTFCKQNKLLHLEPTITDEISLINFIYSCSLLVISWGTAFLKNYIYVSEKCKQIIVLVIGPNFINQYNDHRNKNNLITKYKNATISYYISDTNLNIDLSKHLKVFD